MIDRPRLVIRRSDPGERRWAVSWGVSWVESHNERWFAGVWVRAGRFLVLVRRASWWDPPSWWLFRRQPIRTGAR